MMGNGLKCNHPQTQLPCPLHFLPPEKSFVRLSTRYLHSFLTRQPVALDTHVGLLI